MAAKLGWRGSIQDRFERFTIPEPNSGCLLWLGASHRLGYGQLRINGKTVAATHIALQLAGRSVPNGKRALHSCDNPYCVNEDHLFIGEQIDNVHDMISKGRHNFQGLELGRGWQGKRSHCGRGHLLEGANVVIRAGHAPGSTMRECRICGRASRSAWKKRRRNGQA